MKKSILIAFALILVLAIYGQTPQAFKYQAVVRNNSGNILQNQGVDVRISIHDATAGGTIVYQETFTESTNDFGLVNLKIGTGSQTIGTFSAIDWASDSKFLETEIDNGGGYVSMGTSELLSVPYAKVADVSRDAVWEKSGSDIYSSNSGKVGIGTETPEGKLEVNAPSGYFGYISPVKGLIIKDGNDNSGNEFEILDFSNNPRFRVLDNGTTILGQDSKCIQMRTDGIFTDIESLGSDLAINYQSGYNTYMNVSSGFVGIGTTNPNAKLQANALWDIAISGYSVDNFGVYGYSTNSEGVTGETNHGIGIHGVSSNGYAGYFNGNVVVTGSLSKGSGSFVIDHPLDPENKILRHNFVESPENLVVYRGKAKLNSIGESIVKVPEYFDALSKEDEATIILTSIGKPFLTGYDWETGFMSFKVYGEPGREVSWVVYADRDDPVIHELGRPVEEEKGPDNKLCDKGKLLYPKAYGYPESKGRDYDKLSKMRKQNKNSQ